LGTATGLLWSVCVVNDSTRDPELRAQQGQIPAPLKVGSRSRMHVELVGVKEQEEGAEAIYRLEYEIEDSPKPCCVAELVFRYYD
jgi:hypothetical protein